MHSFNVDGQTIELDENSSLDYKKFLELKEALNTSENSTILQIAFILRFNYEQSRSLFDMAYLRAKDDTERETIQSQIIGLMLQHNQDVITHLEGAFVSGDKRFEYLKGIFFMKNGQYHDAEFCFETAGYKRGIEICKVLRNDIEEMEKSTDPITQCYASSKNWKNYDGEIKNKDFEFAIGKSNEYENESNIDVKLALFNKELEEIVKKEMIKRNDLKSSTDCNVHLFNDDLIQYANPLYIEFYKEDLNLLLEKLVAFSDNNKPLAYIFYTVGKAFHLLKNFEKAQEWYNKTLLLDSGYVPAQYNLNRIHGTIFNSQANSSKVHDFNALISLKKLIFDFPIGNCSDFIRKFYRVVVQSRKLDKTIANDLKSMKSLFNEVEISNNLAIIIEGQESIAILEDLLAKVNSSYKDYILYNLGIMKKDQNLLKESSLPEAQLQLDYLRKDTNTKSKSLLAYLTKDKNLLESDAFGHIMGGFICIDEYLTYLSEDNELNHKKDNCTLDSYFNLLDEAEKMFLKETSSMYSVNGLGICALLRGNIASAIKLFEQVGEHFKKNLANCYLLLKDYSKATDLYLRSVNGQLTEKDIKILEFLGQSSKDPKSLKVLISLGLDGLKDHLAMVYLGKGDVQSAKEMNISNPEIQKKIEESMAKEEERKRKIAEIEEYRKKRKNI